MAHSVKVIATNNLSRTWGDEEGLADLTDEEIIEVVNDDVVGYFWEGATITVVRNGGVQDGQSAA